MRRWCSSVVAIALLSPVAPVSAQQTSAQGVVQDDIRIRLPLAPCALPVLASLIARSTHVPMGIEAAPEICDVDRKAASDPRDEVSIQGRSVTEALDALVQMDPRYGWTESEGVLVVRPTVASADPTHFLHRTIPSLEIVDERLTGALEKIVNTFSPVPGTGADQFAARTPDGNRRFTVSVSATSIVDALNATVRAHGAMTWLVRYCQPAARSEYALISFSTFDGSGLGIHAAARADDGKIFDACQRQK